MGFFRSSGGGGPCVLGGAAVAVFVVLAAGCSSSQSGPAPDEPPGSPSAHEDEDLSELLAVDASTRAEVVDAAAAELRDRYVYPDVGAQAATVIVEHLDDGDYEGLDLGLAFARRLTADLQQVTDDKHLRVTFHPPVPAGGPLPGAVPPEGPPPGPGPGEVGPGGVTEVDTIDGEVGLIALRTFPPPNPDTVAAVADAMQQVAGTRALVFDLRANRGGHPETVALWCSYLLGPPPVELITIPDRDGTVRQRTATREGVQGPRYTDGEVFVLTSAETFSGGEEFTYNLKHLDRATVIGQSTAGGAHLVRRVPLTDTFDIGVPDARPVHAVTGSNWEGTGVTPDIDVAPDQALEAALEAAGD